MFNFLKKEKSTLSAPDNGLIIPITEVEDPVFAGKMMGDGFAVIPETGKIISPCNGEILQVFKTKHAIVIRSADGLELIVHIGLETVALKGQGFDVAVSEGQKIKTGDLMVTADIEFLKAQGKPLVTPVVVTNMDIMKNIEVNKGMSEAGSPAMSYQLK